MQIFLLVSEAIFWDEFCELIEICLHLTVGLVTCSSADGWVWALIDKWPSSRGHQGPSFLAPLPHLTSFILIKLHQIDPFLQNACARHCDWGAIASSTWNASLFRTPFPILHPILRKYAGSAIRWPARQWVLISKVCRRGGRSFLHSPPMSYYNSHSQCDIVLGNL